MTNATAEQKTAFQTLVSTVAKMKNMPEWKAALWLTSIGSAPANMF
jgi:hypothetical protein